MCQPLPLGTEGRTLTAYLYFKCDKWISKERDRERERERNRRGVDIVRVDWMLPKVQQLADWYMRVTGQTSAGREGQHDDWIAAGVWSEVPGRRHVSKSPIRMG